MRTAGDLVARMQLNRGMRIDAAKSYVADKLGVSVPDLADSVTMAELREDRDIGVVIDNCLGFLYSMDLMLEMRREIGQIESKLFR